MKKLGSRGRRATKWENEGQTPCQQILCYGPARMHAALNALSTATFHAMSSIPSQAGTRVQRHQTLHISLFMSSDQPRQHSGASRNPQRVRIGVHGKSRSNESAINVLRVRHTTSMTAAWVAEPVVPTTMPHTPNNRAHR